MMWYRPTGEAGFQQAAASLAQLWLNEDAACSDCRHCNTPCVMPAASMDVPAAARVPTGILTVVSDNAMPPEDRAMTRCSTRRSYDTATDARSSCC